jgi:F-type H+-transporting ATPase subunit delta
MEILSPARPYAKAIFALALRDQQFFEWQKALNTFAAIAVECKKRFLLNNPRVGRKQKLDFFCDALENFPMAINLIRMLVERKKLEILPNIALGYQQLLFEHEKTLVAKVITTHELSVEQREQLLKALQQRYQQRILLQCQIDAKLIGGAVIYIDGRVIDGSIKGMLQRLKQSFKHTEMPHQPKPCAVCKATGLREMLEIEQTLFL